MKKIVQAHTDTLKIALTGLILLTTINILSASPEAGKGTATGNYSLASKICCGKRNPLYKKNDSPLYGRKLYIQGAAKLDSVTKLLRLKLYINQYNYDDIAIGFNSGASFAYNPEEDSKYMPGIDAPEGLASYSSDGVPLSINFLSLPKQSPEVIRLDVEAESSGNITLKRTELDSIPSIYSLWLVDKYKKDSINLRVDSNYVFYINKADTATFGSYRFTVVVSQSPAPAFQLSGFNAIKANNGAQISWTTKNEGNDTHFNVERSSDGGGTFETIDSLLSVSTGTYSSTDHNPPAASDKYRLKVKDLNDAITYSNEITLIFANMVTTVKGNISVYPNPVSGELNLTINQNNNASNQNAPAVSNPETPVVPNTILLLSLAAVANGVNPSYGIKIINITGRVVKESTSSSSNWQSDVSSLSPGTYIIQVTDKGKGSMVGRGLFVKM
jgi:hypothetical protein